MTPPVTGGCQCGAIRYRVTAPAAWTGFCHCRMCQRAHGAPVVLWLQAPAGGIAFDRGALRWFRSSAEAERGFCGDCGTPVAWKAVPVPTPDPGMDIAAATLDDPSIARPEMHLWCESALPGMIPDDHLPHLSRGRKG